MVTAVLDTTQITSLKCASHPAQRLTLALCGRCALGCHSRLSSASNARAFSPVCLLTCLLLRSLEKCNIGVEGCKAIATVMDKTQITTLKCASHPSQRRLDFAWTLCSLLFFFLDSVNSH